MILHLCQLFHGKLVKTAKLSGPLHCHSISSGKHCIYLKCPSSSRNCCSLPNSTFGLFNAIVCQTNPPVLCRCCAIQTVLPDS